MARLHDLKHFDSQNTYFGVATSLWFNHCPFHCKGCWNEQTWEKDDSLERPNSEIIAETLLALDEFGLHKDLSLLGGDPLSPLNIFDTLEILKGIKKARPETRVVCWTGFTYERIINKEVLDYIDILIDGRFVEALKVENYKLYGSSNQRVIDVQKSLAQNKVVIATK